MNQSKQSQLEHNLDVLGAKAGDSLDDIEKQYRQLAQRWHPDRNTSEAHEPAKAKFIEINSAYKYIRSHYRITSSVPGFVANERPGPLLGTKKQTRIKPALYKNKIVLAGAVTMILAILFGALLWSLDSRLVENNRGRAMTGELEQTIGSTLTPAATDPAHEEASTQSHADVTF